MAKQVDWPYVINLGNSIIGVSVLAMPFCFKECGLLLGMILLLGSGWLASVSCSLLMKAAVASKKRSYEFLALHVLGRVGKLAVELSIIGLLLGTCIAFYVVIGDLGPIILSKILNLENTSSLRSGFMMCIAMFVALPLGLLKNVESLSNVSAISLGFYCVFVAEVFSAAFPNLWSGVWVTKVSLWNPEGVFKCLPIFSLAFGCQTQLFVMYDALPEPSLSRMSAITKNAVSLCTGVYLSVGYFGYVAFCDEEIAGDILMNFRPTIFSEAVKLGFVLSVAASFPLVIFPCRTSIHSLLFAKTGTHENFGGSPIIPEPHFKIITVSIIGVTLVIGILIPNIEFVLALTGATMGALICFIFPAVMFISLMSMSNTNTKSIAQVVLFLGVTILLASTYVTLYSEEKGSSSSLVKMPVPHDHIDPAELPIQNNLQQDSKDIQARVKEKGESKVGEDAVKAMADEAQIKLSNEEDKKNEEVQEDKRQEPPVPHAPLEAVDADTVEKGQEDEKKTKETKIGEVKKEGTGKNATAIKDAVINKSGKIRGEDDKEKKEQRTEEGKDDEVKKESEKEAKENEETGKLLEELKAQREEQQDLINQQKAIIAELKKHQDEAHPKQEGGEIKDGQKTGETADRKEQPPIADQQQQREQNVPLANQKVNQPGQQPVNQQAPPNQPVNQQKMLNQQPINKQPVVDQQPVNHKVVNQQLLPNQPPVKQQALLNQQPPNQQPLPNHQPVQQQQQQQQPLIAKQQDQNLPNQKQPEIQHQQVRDQHQQLDQHQNVPMQQQYGQQQQQQKFIPAQNNVPNAQLIIENDKLLQNGKPLEFNRVADGNINEQVLHHQQNNQQNIDKTLNRHFNVDKVMDPPLDQKVDPGPAAG